MYVAGRDHPHRAAAKEFLVKVRDGEIEGVTSTEVLQEILYRYAALKRLDLATGVYDLFLALCSTILPVELADTDRAKSLLAKGIGVRDAIHAATMLNHSITHVATFDAAFDQIAGIKRIDLV